MTDPCNAPGCTKSRSHLSSYCPAHRNRAQRYGHPLQKSVSARDVAPFECRAVSRIADDDGVRDAMTANWRRLVADVGGVASSGIVRGALGDPSGDRRATTTERDAARLFALTATATDDRTVADLVLGLTMMRAMSPATFESDRAFRFILARRFLSLSTTNAVKDRRSGSTTYRVHPVDVVLSVAGWLVDAFGQFAEKIAERERDAVADAERHEAHMRQTLSRL